MYSSANNIRMIKPRRMRSTGHVEHMGEHKMLVRKPEKINY
jgi:hypothetical protein